MSCPSRLYKDDGAHRYASTSANVRFLPHNTVHIDAIHMHQYSKRIDFPTHPYSIHNMMPSSGKVFPNRCTSLRTAFFCGSWWKAFVKPKTTNSFPVLGSHGNPFLFNVTEKISPLPAPGSRKSALGRGDTSVFQSITFPWSSFGLLTFPSRQTQGNALNNRVSK